MTIVRYPRRPEGLTEAVEHGQRTGDTSGAARITADRATPAPAETAAESKWRAMLLGKSDTGGRDE